MKHFKRWSITLFLLIMLIVSAAAYGDSLPDSLALAFASSQWKGWSAACFANSGDTVVVILQKGQTNCLCVLSRETQGWKLVCSSKEAIYQGSRLPYRIELEDGAFNLWYDNKTAPDNLLRFAVNKNVWRISRLEIWDKSLDYDTIVVYSDKLVFKDTVGDEKQTTVYGVTCRDLAYVDFNHFPLTPQKAAEELSNPPAIPPGDLACEVIDFQGDQRFPLYAGPGTDYHRPVNGKCVVSTNDWIQVFGQENGWLLVQYDRSSDQMRFGYIQATALDKSSTSINDIDDLGFVYTPVRTTYPVSLTDDPLFAQESLGYIVEGAEVVYLAAMGDWAHVEATIGKETFRGFVPLDALAFPDSAYGLNAEFNGYAVSGQAELSPDNQLTVVLTLSGDESQTISGYQVYLDHTVYLLAPVYLVNGQPTLSFTLPIAGEPVIIGLCPVDASGALLTDQTLTFQPE